MIVSAGLALPSCGVSAAVADEEVGDVPDAVVRVDDARLSVRAHSAAADEVRVRSIVSTSCAPAVCRSALLVVLRECDVGAVVFGALSSKRATGIPN